MIRYHIYKTRQEALLAVALLMFETIRDNPTKAIGLATGTTMKEIYAEVVRLLLEAGISLAQLLTFNLDEWTFLLQGLLKQDDIRGFEPWMRREFHSHLVPLGFDLNNAHFPSHFLKDHTAIQADLDLSAYDSYIEHLGGVFKWFVGIGQGSKEQPRSGHIAFIERDHNAGPDKRSYTGKLHPQTIMANLGYEGCDNDPAKVPNLAITVGPATVLATTNGIVLSAFGSSKALPIVGACEDPYNPECSASLIQLYPDHLPVDVYLDEAAALHLQRADRVVYGALPSMAS